MTDGHAAGRSLHCGLPENRMIQEYVLERAARADVPVIATESQTEAVSAVMNLVLEQAERVAAQGVR
jgi:2-phosphoglycerate kinase